MNHNYFCSICGNHYELYHEICPVCETGSLIKYDNSAYLVKRICATCENSNIIFNTPSFFEENPLCVVCGNPLEVVEIHNDTLNFKIGSIWNGGNVGKKISEKNKQLKKKYAGMEGDERNLRREINVKSMNLFGKNENKF